MSQGLTVEVQTEVGLVTGSLCNGIIDFAGVRYGDPLVDDRFSELGEPRSAQSPPAALPQRPGALDALLGNALGELPQHESAFVLRIQVPEGAVSLPGGDDAGLLPVLVFIPGGGFLSGAAHARWFEQSPLVTEGPLVLVTVNYRVGALGHLGHEGDTSEANRGLRDLKRALRWVRAHIAAFGGDPERVTLAGDSAGAWYAHALSVAADTEGLIARTALISFPFEPPLDSAAYAARRSVALDALESNQESLAVQPIDRLLDAQGAVARSFAGKGMALMPAVSDGEVPEDLANARAQSARLHVGSLALLTASEEAAAFLRAAPEAAFPQPAVDGYLATHFADPAEASRLLEVKRPDATPKERMIDAMTLYQFRSAALELAEAASGSGHSVFVAQLSVQSELERAYSPHCFPLPFIFGNREKWHDAPMLDGLDETLFQHTSAVLQEWLLGFVRAGVPGIQGAGQPAFDQTSPLSLEIDDRGARLQKPPEWGLATVRAGDQSSGSDVGDAR